MLLPLAAAARDSGSSTPVQYGSWVKAVDEKGDRNAIGKFNSEEANKRLMRFEGTVTAVSTTSITLKHGNSDKTIATKTFVIDSSTTIIRKFKGTAGIGEVSVGDRVKVWTTSATSTTVKLLWDKSIWWVALKGIVSSLNTTDHTFMLTVVRKEPETGLDMIMNVPITTSSATKYWMDSTEKTFSDLVSGQKVNVRGSFDTVTKSIWAQKITISS